MFVIPDVLGFLPLGEKEKIRLDAGVGCEDAVGQADDGVQVAFVEELFLDARSWTPSPKRVPSGRTIPRGRRASRGA